jgi:uncharacterized DUF497 family protein
VELEWDEEKRQRTLLERGLDFADIARFEPDGIATYVDE